MATGITSNLMVEVNLLVISNLVGIGSNGLEILKLGHIVLECQFCSKRGHTAPNCWNISTAYSSIGQLWSVKFGEKKEHSAINCCHKDNFAYQKTASAHYLSAMQAHTPQSF